ncbi:Trafficking protein particle complex subunit 11 [Quillaja saponaria]|uniref:Trafficking protein particle complex subunit 11 n=1 Tax=Quillaja saponaria TaxID=32244 RepID=A0AAD7P6J3_QUISA|nr:Trafficking protein particle complex subunit 11 [Quillaja saponaria]
MEEYPEELRTPPVALISVVGCPELHSQISAHLHSEQPPTNTLALPDFSKISLFSKKKKDSESNPTSPHSSIGGILKRDWLLKHRTKIPAVLVALFRSEHVSGDPAHWLQVCSDLDSIKNVVRAKNIKLVIVVVHSDAHDDISEDRMIALRKRAEVDSKYVVIFNPDDTSELKQSLSRLGSTFAELANTYYRDEGRRIKTRIDKKNSNAIELNIRYCFKVAVYAEFRRDWVEALRFYEDAYHTLREIVGVSTRLPAVQRLVEIKTIAEQVHFKISTLLLHSGKIIEAVTWFHQHQASYRKMVGPPEAIFLHYEWMSRQFLVFGELLETSSKTIQGISSIVIGSSGKPFSEWECYPAYYYQLAAHYLKEKRSTFEVFARLLEQGDAFAMLPLTDEEYISYAVSEGKRFRDSIEIIALLKKAYELYSSLKVHRMGSFCGFQIAKEHYAEGDVSNAKKIFGGIASLYRQEGWVTLLWEVLGYLRECSRKNGSVKDFVEYSLEMAALPVSSDTDVQRDCGPAGPANLMQRISIHKEVFEIIGEVSGSASIEDTCDMKITKEKPLHLEIDIVSPLRLVLLASVAFHEQTIKPGSSASITVSLLSQLPGTIEIEKLEIHFNQSDCNFFIVNAQIPQSAEVNDVQGHRVEIAPSLLLASNKWLRLTYEIKSDQSGKLECLSVIAKLGPHLTICCRAESPASMSDLPLWKFEDRVQTFPVKDPVLALSGQKASQVEEPDPEVDLHLGASGPALVGEIFMVPVTVVSKGHAVYSGELKINLVDVRGGGLFSPRETEPFSMDSHHVELLGISGPEGEDESQLDSDDIKRIQQSFGLISVPFLQNGDSCHHHMLPIRQVPLLLSRIKEVPDSDQSASLPLNETNILIVSAKNCSEVPLRLKSMSIDVEDDATERACSIRHGDEDFTSPALLVPGEEFKKVFSVISDNNISKLSLGTVCLRWRRDLGIEEQSDSSGTVPWVVSEQKLPDVKMELPPLIVSLECPPYAILGDPFTYYVKIRNQTQLLQEIKFSLGDAQSFVLSGCHNDIFFVLPKSDHVLSYNLVPLASGMQQLPRFTMTAVRYSAGFQPSISASSVFVFPSKPHFEMAASSNNGVKLVATE